MPEHGRNNRNTPSILGLESTPLSGDPHGRFNGYRSISYSPRSSTSSDREFSKSMSTFESTSFHRTQSYDEDPVPRPRSSSIKSTSSHRRDDFAHNTPKHNRPNTLPINRERSSSIASKSSMAVHLHRDLGSFSTSSQPNLYLAEESSRDIGRHRSSTTIDSPTQPMIMTPVRGSGPRSMTRKPISEKYLTTCENNCRRPYRSTEILNNPSDGNTETVKRIVKEHQV